MIICLAKCHTSGVINKLNLSTTGKAQRKVQVIASDFRILRLILHGNDKLRILRFFFFFFTFYKWMDTASLNIIYLIVIAFQTHWFQQENKFQYHSFLYTGTISSESFVS